jgi:hypothetical protein
MPCHPARARRLLAEGRAVVARHTPFVIRLKDREARDSAVQPVEVKTDPGSRYTGIAIVTTTEAGELRGLHSVQANHRGHRISTNLSSRSDYRSRRRTTNLRYRSPRFSNRHPGRCDACGANAPKVKHGKGRQDRCRPCQAAKAPRTGARGISLAPSLQHRVDGVMSQVTKLRRWAPISAISMELVRFDMQKLENPEIAGVEYQQGTLAGFETREYLLAKWNHRCAYCGASGVGPGSVPLNVDHIHPRSKGGSNRVSNLALSCIPCNQAKDNRSVEEFLVGRPEVVRQVLAQAKAPLKDAAAVNSTRWALWRALMATGLPVATGSGGQTKWNRTRFGLPKTHTLDAICVGEVSAIASYPDTITVAGSAGRGMYQRTKIVATRHCRGCGGTYSLKDYVKRKEGERRLSTSVHFRNRFCPKCRKARNYTDSGFRYSQSPFLQFPRMKKHFGFVTGDLVRAVVPSGKYAGVHVGRVAVRARGVFVVTTPTGKVETSHRNCRVLQRADGWTWSHQPEGVSNAT